MTLANEDCSGGAFGCSANGAVCDVSEVCGCVGADDSGKSDSTRTRLDDELLHVSAPY